MIRAGPAAGRAVFQTVENPTFSFVDGLAGAADGARRLDNRQAQDQDQARAAGGLAAVLELGAPGRGVEVLRG